MSRAFWSPTNVLLAATFLRLVLLVYGLIQDAYSPVKYTDIDYFVFTDAARYASRGQSPYARETYRYTPLLAWLLLPTTWTSFPGATFWFSFGKLLFSAADLLAGWMIFQVLRNGEVTSNKDGKRMSVESGLKFASIWLLNPMVATISTRGSSEGLLGVMVIGMLWAGSRGAFVLQGLLLGLGVHFKIYPVIYAPALIWSLEAYWQPYEKQPSKNVTVMERAKTLITSARALVTSVSLSTFIVLNTWCYFAYGQPFLQETFLHHLSRLDHRHNFSPYNILLYLSSSQQSQSHSFRFESLAFIPQLFLSGVLIPLFLAKRDLGSTMLAQTFAFVTFNKVCTSQYFIWYIALLPFYLPTSRPLARPALGLTALGAWIGAQALWLQQGYQLEFLGRSTFFPGLWLTSLVFFATNVWILGIVVEDVGSRPVQYSAAWLKLQAREAK
ncbi:GPI mannosyltransferase 1 [Agyrium rufum]|nr:GPI mannosyltransferase 1 [Agyrium rufum]